MGQKKIMRPIKIKTIPHDIFKFQITCEEEYFDEIKEWCEEMWGPKTFTLKYQPLCINTWSCFYNDMVYLTNDDQLTLFKLRWV